MVLCSRTKYEIMKKIEGDAIFSRSFLNFEKSITLLFLIVVEKSPNKSYRAMQYLQNEHPMSNRTRLIGI